MKYNDWLDRWLNVYVKPTVKERTYLCYANISRLHIKPALGGLRLTDITLPVLHDFGAKLYTKYSANTVRLIYFVINSSLRCAAEEKLVAHTEKLKNPKLREKKIECFTVGEQKKIESFILNSGKTKYFGIILSLYTGLRIGELMALEWRDIDLKKGVISVNKNCTDKWIDGKYIKNIDTPKTDSSVRLIPLPRRLVPVLSLLRKLNGGAFVVCGKYGKEFSVRSYQSTFNRLLNKLGIPHKGFHALRHTFATRALECGMDVKTLSEIMGHSDPTVTLRRYAHSLTRHKREMMNKLGRLYSR